MKNFSQFTIEQTHPVFNQFQNKMSVLTVQLNKRSNNK